MNIFFGLLFLFNAYASAKTFKEDSYAITTYEGSLRIFAIVLSAMFGLMLLICRFGD